MISEKVWFVLLTKASESLLSLNRDYFLKRFLEKANPSDNKHNK